MNDKKSFDLLMQILRFVICNNLNAPHLGSDECLNAFAAAKKHSVYQIVSYYMLNNINNLSEELKQSMEHALDYVNYRCVKRDFLIDEIKRVFNENKLPFILLKGCVMKQYYPYEYLRTSGDIDILVHHDDIEKAKRVLVSVLKCKQGITDNHHTSFRSQLGYNIELHRRLYDKTYGNYKADSVLKQVWNYADSVRKSGYEYVLRDEMFYYYHLHHLMRHFERGNCKIIQLLDLWLLNHCGDFDRKKREALIIKGGMKVFAEAMISVSEKWFSGKEETDTAEIESYILSGQESFILNQLQKGQTKTGYLLRRIFCPYYQMEYLYPRLKKYKILLPFCHIHRWFRLFNPAVRKKKKQEFNLILKGGESAYKSVSLILEKTGIKDTM
ncbi:MAG: nucleotidyltransferase family protein [Clostridiales bacterium]|nr:nucleotidyltransferase family protein [Clostridiales bacterium]